MFPRLANPVAPLALPAVLVLKEVLAVQPTGDATVLLVTVHLAAGLGLTAAEVAPAGSDRQLYCVPGLLCRGCVHNIWNPPVQ